VEKDDWGRHRFLGYVVQADRWTLYHAGDTKLFEDMEARLRPFQIDIALLPINGDRPERRVAGNLSGSEAAALAKEIGARIAIPCHYDMFEFNTVTPDEFADTARALQQHYCILRAGERWTSGALPP